MDGEIEGPAPSKGLIAISELGPEVCSFLEMKAAAPLASSIDVAVPDRDNVSTGALIVPAVLFEPRLTMFEAMTGVGMTFENNSCAEFERLTASCVVAGGLLASLGTPTWVGPIAPVAIIGT